MKEINTLVFSDVHLGAPTSRAFELINTLKEYHFKRLIIAGDMFEDLNFQHLKSTHWELLEHIGKLSRRGVDVVWLEGNHDIKFYHFMAQMIGIPAHMEYEWEVNGRRFLALHGHRFDNFLTNNDMIGRVLASFYTWLQRKFSSHLMDIVLFKLSDRWMRVKEQVAKKAVEYAKKKNCDVVICGHTHFVDTLKEDSVEYYNVGCWNSSPSYILVVQDDGTSELKVIP